MATLSLVDCVTYDRRAIESADSNITQPSDSLLTHSLVAAASVAVAVSVRELADRSSCSAHEQDRRDEETERARAR